MSANDKDGGFDKQFLRQNDLATFIKRGVPFFERYRIFLITLVFVGVLAAVGYVVLEDQNHKVVLQFNERLAAVAKSPQKVDGYRKVVAEFSALPAVNLARLRLAETLLENQKTDDALKILDEGLGKSGTDVFTTLLVLKKIDVLKSEKKYDDALKVLRASRDKVLGAYGNELSLQEAQLALLSGRKDEARKIYDGLAALKVEVPKDGDLEPGIDESVISTAKEQLLLLDLGVL